LAIVHAIVSDARGTISFTDDAAGATVTVTLPAAVPNDRHPTAA
jgi:C4-dicarboxylate-specific signal transduction histidine kinase